MGRQPKIVWIVVVLLIAAVCTGAAVDHQEKQASLHRARIDGWFCTHRGTRCGSEPAGSIESDWNRREAVYAATVIALSAAGVVAHIRLRRRTGSH